MRSMLRARARGEPIAGSVERRVVSRTNDEVVTSFGEYAGDHLAKPATGAGHQRHSMCRRT
jgi:hypothetical protein